MRINPPFRGCFVTGTDTGVGKTVVAASLCRAAVRSGLRTVAIKPIQTGIAAGATSYGAEGSDASICRSAVPKTTDPEMFRSVTLRTFAMPSSPHLAAKCERLSIDTTELISEIQTLQQQYDMAILEGAGGLLVPIDERKTMVDLIAETGLPTVLVVGNRLGCINHALLSLNELKRRDLPIAGLVICHLSPPSEDEITAVIESDNPNTISTLGDTPVLASIPFLAGLHSDILSERESAWETFENCIEPVIFTLQKMELGLVKCTINTENTEGNADHSWRIADSEISQMIDSDRAILWHPYTSATDPHPVELVSETNGATMTLADGRVLIDGMSSWWCAIHGYNHPQLCEAIRRQVNRMPHVMFGGITHEPAVRLGESLRAILPDRLSRVFFADSGSVSVEISMKMAIQYWQALGRSQKHQFMTFRGGYHGDTLGAMSVCDPVNGMHTLFQGVIPSQIFLPRPAIPFAAASEPLPPSELELLESAFAEHADRTAAFILEPIVQGAGGMWFYHPEYLSAIRRLCDRHDVLLIADEIATGFGRTGQLFGVNWSNIQPDIMCIGKALSGGMMTFAATIATDRVASRISEDGNVFMHGPTFMANPMACAVSLASLELIAEGRWQHDVRRIERELEVGLAPCRGLESVIDVRVLGGIGVVEMKSPVNIKALQSFFVQRGVWVRPFGRLIYLMPPYCTTDEQLAELTSAVVDAAKNMDHNSL